MLKQQPINWIGIIDNAFAVYSKQLRLFIANALTLYNANLMSSSMIVHFSNSVRLS